MLKLRNFLLILMKKLILIFDFSALKLSNYYSTYRPGINEKQSQNKVRQMAKSQKSFWIVNKNGIKLNLNKVKDNFNIEKLSKNFKLWKNFGFFFVLTRNNAHDFRYQRHFLSPQKWPILTFHDCLCWLRW